MLALIANGKKITCPNCWEDCNTEQYQRLFKSESNPVGYFCALTGMNYAGLMDDDSGELETIIYQCTAFISNQDPDFKKIEAPQAVKIRGKAIIIPKNIGRLTVGQNFFIRQAMSQAKHLDDLISLVCAVFLQPLVDESKFDIDRAKELEKEILLMSIYETYPIGFFFLTKLNNYGSSGLVGWLREKARRIRSAMFLLLWPVSKNLPLLMICLSLILTARRTDNYQVLCSKSHSMSSCHSYIYGRNVTNTINGMNSLINS